GNSLFHAAQYGYRGDRALLYTRHWEVQNQTVQGFQRGCSSHCSPKEDRVKRASYQHGSVELKKLKKGPDVWVFRYMDGGRRKSKRLGTALQVRSKSAAKKAALKFLDEINNRINC